MGIETVMIGLIPGTVVGVIGFFLVKTLKDIEGKIDKNEIATLGNEKKIENVEEKLTEKIDSVGKELSEHRELVQRDFITKQEHARTYGEISKKLDKIQDYLMQLVKERR
jgi:hypothetical protein